jgi:flagellar basal body rod protein FlgG
MAGGIYAALSGLQSTTARLDRIAGDIGNASTIGYRSERSALVQAERPSFSDVLDSAVDVSLAPASSDFRTGAIAPTGRNLDVAVEGGGFFVLQTPAGVRYTRNGHFTRSVDGTLAAQHGTEVLGIDGKPIKLGTADVEIESDGTVKAGGVRAGQIQVVTFADPTKLVRGDGVRFRAPEGMTAVPDPEARVQAGALESANVSLPERMAQLVQLSRGFEALQRGLSVLTNEVDGRAIVELGRR